MPRQDAQPTEGATDGPCDRWVVRQATVRPTWASAAGRGALHIEKSAMQNLRMHRGRDKANQCKDEQGL